jgi:hypothetical protein
MKGTPMEEREHHDRKHDPDRPGATETLHGQEPPCDVTDPFEDGTKPKPGDVTFPFEDGTKPKPGDVTFPFEDGTKPKPGDVTFPFEDGTKPKPHED